MNRIKIINKAKKKRVMFRQFKLEYTYITNSNKGGDYLRQLNKYSLKGRENIV